MQTETPENNHDGSKCSKFDVGDGVPRADVLSKMLGKEENRRLI